MFNIILRRFQRILLPVKIVILFAVTGLLGYLIINVSPDTASITLVATIFFVFLAILLNFFLSANRSLLTALAVAFFLFLKATNLFSLVNIILFAIFFVLLGLYLRKR
jgi:hypothetical protein